MVGTNQYGSLSFMFRRGSIPAGPAGQLPVMAIDYLGGPLLDLDGVAGGPRSRIPVPGQTAVEMPGTRSFIDLNFDAASGLVGLNGFDATATNQGFSSFGPGIAVTVHNLAGTMPNALGQSGPINPSVDTRSGTLSTVGPQIQRITNLGYEVWQDSIDETSSSASTLGTFQYLGAMNGWLIERDAAGNFPTLAGLGLATGWPAVAPPPAGVFNQTTGLPPTVAITDGVPGDVFSATGNGGLALADFGGDLGAYLDAVVVPRVDPLSGSFVYLESAGFGMNNSFDPVFADTNGYDMVLIAQSTPIPEPATAMLVAAAGLWLGRRQDNRRNRRTR